MEAATPLLAEEARRGYVVTKGGSGILEGCLLLVLAGLLFVDRGILCAKFLFKYFDQDQSLIWYAANELIRGHFHEPCFYGQSYNSCIEGYLAIPLVFCGVPFHIAVPLVTVILGLLPFLVIAWCAWRRGQLLVAATALLVPLILPERYDIETGIPRGFVMGNALAIVPAILAAAPVVFGSQASVAILFIALLAGTALMLNPGCALLLLAVAVYCVARYAGMWRFWVFTPLGLLAAALYPLFVGVFYWVWHDDYRLHHRGMTFPWGVEYFEQALHWVPTAFSDLVPMGVPKESAPIVLMLAFVAVCTLLTARLRLGLLAGALAALTLTMMSLAYSRLQLSYETILLSYSRNFLALPVLFVWLLYAAGPARRARIVSAAVARWTTCVVMGCMIVLCGWGVVHRYNAMPQEIEAALQGTMPMEVVDIDEARAFAATIDCVAAREHADLVLLAAYQEKKWAYALPVMSNCDTLYPFWDRRTWRLHEENHPLHERILLTDQQTYIVALKKHYPHTAIVNRDPPVFAFDTGGKSVVAICRDLNVRLRQFDDNAP